MNFLFFKDNVVEGDVSIDPKHHKYLASRRAQVLRDVADEYGGVSISLPKDNCSSKVTLKGKLGNILDIGQST